MDSRQAASPFAYDKSGRAVHVSSAKQGIRYACIGCGRPVTLRREGAGGTYHFVHAAKPACAPGTALHEMSILHIIKRFYDSAGEDHHPFMTMQCAECGQAIPGHHPAAYGTSIVRDVQVFDDITSDLVVLSDNKTMPRIIIEVVVAGRELEQDKREAYPDAHMPVIVVQPSWDGLDSVWYTMNITCTSCVMRLNNLMAFMLDRRKDKNAMPVKIVRGAYTDDLPPELACKMNDYALRLSARGFVQPRSEPTLFVYEDSDWMVLVDLDALCANEFTPASKVPTLAVHTMSRGKDERKCRPDCKECVLEAAEETLEFIGIKTSRLVENEKGHWHRPL